MNAKTGHLYYTTKIRFGTDFYHGLLVIPKEAIVTKIIRCLFGAYIPVR